MIAEKYHAMVMLGQANNRMKDAISCVKSVSGWTPVNREVILRVAAWPFATNNSNWDAVGHDRRP